MRKQQRLYMAVACIIFCAVIAVVAAYPLIQPAPVTSTAAGAQAAATQQGSASTPYGESLSIRLSTGAQTTGASWLADYIQSATQNVWTVNGTYKSQAQVTLGYSLSVTYTQVTNIQVVNLYIKAVDAADSSSYTYTLASSKALSGSSPISDSNSTTKTISQHLTDVAATSPATVKYYIYCKVTAVGSVSGQTLTAEIVETYFTTLVYTQQTESTNTSVTPTVSVASWAQVADAAAVFGIAVLVAVLVYVVVSDGKKRKKR